MSFGDTTVPILSSYLCILCTVWAGCCLGDTVLLFLVLVLSLLGEGFTGFYAHCVLEMVLYRALSFNNDFASNFSELFSMYGKYLLVESCRTLMLTNY